MILFRFNSFQNLLSKEHAKLELKVSSAEHENLKWKKKCQRLWTYIMIITNKWHTEYGKFFFEYFFYFFLKHIKHEAFYVAISFIIIF